MAITTYPHIIEELRRTANPDPKNRGPFCELAGEMELRESSLGNLLNPFADRTIVKLGLEQSIHIMRRKQNYAALHLLAAECGFALIPLYSKPDKATSSEELLENIQCVAGYQDKAVSKSPETERILALSRLFDNAVQTESIVREEAGQVYRPGQGWVKMEVRA